MSIVVPPVVNKTSVKPFRTVCYDNNLVTSRGVFLGDDPLSFSLPLLLLELPLIFLTSHAIHLLLTPLRQPRVVTQILTGVLFGPSVIGRSFVFQETVFPPRGTFILDTISMLSLNLFLFSIGVKTDLSLLKKPGWRAVTIGIVGSLLPFFLCLVIFAALRGSVPAELAHGTLIMTIAGRLSLSSFAVISHALEEQGLLNSELGRVALTASLITDVCNWAVSSVETAAKLAVKAGSPEMAVASVAALAAFSLFVVFVARPVALWTVRRTPAGQLMDEGHFVAMIVAALLAAFTTEVLGYHAAFGPAMLGLAFPGGMPMGVTLTERLDSFLSGLFLPLYLVLAGYRTDFTDLGSWPTWGTLELVVILCFVGKLVGTIAAALYFKMPFKDALIVGLMVNIKGIIEVSFLNNSGDSEVFRFFNFEFDSLLF
ncbi:Cation/H(+) antiporter 15 [Apostasia shenzhenica]|uniref:Cation/H(+) antiporter 15 n=1 Tax=Apostasia shenzhenica TaxID=1088818 RepID=A0A2I0B5U8_9ASPA|nr:Cation/H(+) antiporter 15 [Apostasia shenzhenica]